MDDFETHYAENDFEQLAVVLLFGECHRLSQYYFTDWFSAVRQQACTCANFNPDLCRHKSSLGHNGLAHWSRDKLDYTL